MVGVRRAARAHGAGELTKGSMQMVINTLKSECNLTKKSLFLDVGSGLGKPPLHVAQVASPLSPLHDTRVRGARGGGFGDRARAPFLTTR